eukprot:SAG31_NODE_7406_length_1697_cov_1.508761_1_plen_389_part_10
MPPPASAGAENGAHLSRLLQLSAQIGADARRRPLAIALSGQPISQDPYTGAITADEIGRLQQRERQLAETRDYRAAADIEAIIRCLGPKREPLQLSDCSPTKLEDQIEFFLENGFCVVRNVAAGHALAELQQSWMRAETPERERWDAARVQNLRSRGEKARPPDSSTPVSHYRGHEASGRLLVNGTAPYDNGKSYPQSTFDLNGLFGVSDAFLDLCDSPKLLPLLAAVCGAGGLASRDDTPDESPYFGHVRCGGMSGRVVPSESNEQGYLSWHRDKPPADGWPLPNYRLIKVFVAIFDIPPNGGATAVVPGTHRLVGQPRDILAAAYGGGATVGKLSHYQMPNFVECAVDAGAAVSCHPRGFQTLKPCGCSYLPPPPFPNCRCCSTQAY